MKIAGLAATEGWSVRQVEEAVRARRDEAAAGGATRQKAVRPAQILALEERLSERLGSPVRIDYGARGGGKLTVRFGSVDDLERIYRTLLG